MLTFVGAQWLICCPKFHHLLFPLSGSPVLFSWAGSAKWESMQDCSNSLLPLGSVFYSSVWSELEKWPGYAAVWVCADLVLLQAISHHLTALSPQLCCFSTPKPSYCTHRHSACYRTPFIWGLKGPSASTSEHSWHNCPADKLLLCLFVWFRYTNAF